MVNNENLKETLADAVMDRPREFFIGKTRYCLWSPSLGVSLMLSRHFETLDLDEEMLSKNPSMEALRLCTLHRDKVCHILAILSFRTFTELSNSNTVRRRAKVFESTLSPDELARIFLFALDEPKVDTLVALSGIGKDQEEQRRIAAHKNKDGHSVSFGGKTIFGTLIDAACSKYGWTKEYVVWGIDLLSLRMMLVDNITSIYLSDEDMKALKISNHTYDRYGMTSEDINRLKAMDWS